MQLQLGCGWSQHGQAGWVDLPNIRINNVGINLWISFTLSVYIQNAISTYILQGVTLKIFFILETIKDLTWP
jgi:hypothetical protein